MKKTDFFQYFNTTCTRFMRNKFKSNLVLAYFFETKISFKGRISVLFYTHIATISYTFILNLSIHCRRHVTGTPCRCPCVHLLQRRGSQERRSLLHWPDEWLCFPAVSSHSTGRKYGVHPAPGKFCYNIRWQTHTDSDPQLSQPHTVLVLGQLGTVWGRSVWYVL